MHDTLVCVCAIFRLKAGSQYDADAVSATGKLFFHKSNSILDVKVFNNLIGWMLATQHWNSIEVYFGIYHPDASKATLVRVSYCEPALHYSTHKYPYITLRGRIRGAGATVFWIQSH